LTSIDIPNSVTEIGDWTFYGCSNLNTVTLSNSVSSINDYTFEECRNLSSTIIPNSVNSIGVGAFAGCSSLTSVNIPMSVTLIDNYAFSNSGLRSAIIPNSVDSIGRGIFSGCHSLKSVTLPSSITSINDNTFEGCSGLNSFTIPNTITTIGKYAFSGCTCISSITIPVSVINIREYAFHLCTSLSSLRFEDNEKYLVVSSEAFDSDMPNQAYLGRQMDFISIPSSALKNITFGEYITYIVGSFSEGLDICTVESYNPIPPETYYTFSDETYQNGTLYVPETAIEAYASAPGWEDFKTIKALGDYDAINNIYNNNDNGFSIDGNTLHLIGDSLVRVVSLNGSTIYNGNGNKDINLAKGMYLVIIGDKASKIVVK
jgi:hypothetical protein